MVETIINNIINLVLAAVVGALIVWVKTSVKNRTNKDKAIETAVKSLAHDALFRQCRYLLDKDYITEGELDNLNHLFAGYEALGMNGTGKQLYEQVKDKPIKG